MEQKHYWRKDITGLRALAVLPVLLFHAFPQWLPGGFYGVDIFFVISGYLISGIIFRGLLTDSFSFKVFYVKRIKRIFPNLIVLLVFVMAAGWFLLSASEYLDLGSNVSRSALFYQNFRLMSNAGYFDAPSHFNSLLHMWSLAIEEQFYLVFPLLAFLIWKLGRKSVTAMGVFVAFITVASLLCCLLLEDSNTRFYFPLSRFWELGAGICLAYAETFYKVNMLSQSRGTADGLSVFGGGMVSVALVVPTNWYAEPPGFFTLVPVVGSCLLICAGAKAVVNRTLLSNGVMVFVGLISYSLYLWHWPLLTFLRISFYEPSVWLTVFALLLSFVASVIVYRFVENPIRRLPAGDGKWVVPILIGLLLGVFFSGKAIRSEQGFPHREMAQVFAYDADWISASEMGRYQKKKGFYILEQRQVPDVVFVGDSHVEQYYPRARLQAQWHHNNIAFVTGPGCMASIGKNAKEQACINAREQLKPLLDAPEFTTLVIAQKWGVYAENGSNVLKHGWDAYRDLIRDFLAAAPERKVFILLDNPWDESANQEFNMMRYVRNRLAYKDAPLTQVPVPMPQDQTWKEGNDYVLARRARSAVYIDPTDAMCPNGICNLLNYMNDDHLRATFVRNHATWIDPVFE